MVAICAPIPPAKPASLARRIRTLSISHFVRVRTPTTPRFGQQPAVRWNSASAIVKRAGIVAANDVI
eukprot:1193707-Prorocentrum_minimum.AAC.1